MMMLQSCCSEQFDCDTDSCCSSSRCVRRQGGDDETQCDIKYIHDKRKPVMWLFLKFLFAPLRQNSKQFSECCRLFSFWEGMSNLQCIAFYACKLIKLSKQKITPLLWGTSTSRNSGYEPRCVSRCSERKRNTGSGECSHTDVSWYCTGGYTHDSCV